MRLDFTDLDVRARRYMCVTAAVAFGEIGKSGEVRGLDDPVGNPQADHDRPRHRYRAVPGLPE